MGLRVLGAQVTNAIIAALLFFALPFTIAPKTILLIFTGVSAVFISLWRYYRMQRQVALSSRTPAFLLGTGEALEELFEEINHNDRYRIRFLGMEPVYSASTVKECTVVVADTRDPLVMRSLTDLYAKSPAVTLLDFANVYEEVFDRVPFAQGGIDGVIESLTSRRVVYDAAKRLFDLSLALSALLIALPFILFGVVGRVITGTPVFFLHTRIGRDGKPFIMLKLGSMLMNDHGDPELQKQNRVTAFGRVLRQSRIDELPQLWNVLRGDLSFIGPRPELPKIAEVYEREILYYHLRHQITPGLSGWAQIHDFDAPRGGADVERTKRKLSFDLYYLKHRSFGLDLAIALKTVRALVSFSGT
jgi:lipopolysaccharide/colanic/teichoic acid biosynthesis glycosyltransferase